MSRSTIEECLDRYDPKIIKRLINRAVCDPQCIHFNYGKLSGANLISYAHWVDMAGHFDAIDELDTFTNKIRFSIDEGTLIGLLHIKSCYPEFSKSPKFLRFISKRSDCDLNDWTISEDVIQILLDTAETDNDAELVKLISVEQLLNHAEATKTLHPVIEKIVKDKLMKDDLSEARDIGCWWLYSG